MRANELFHASLETYLPGRILQAPERLGSPVEMVLGRLRPADKPSRLHTWFACGSPADCAAYLEAQQRSGFNRSKLVGPPHYYGVTMPSAAGLPMALVERLRRELEVPRVHIDAIGREYWHPQEKWLFWEFLDEQMSIVAEVSPPSPQEIGISIWHYMADQERAKVAWPSSGL